MTFRKQMSILVVVIIVVSILSNSVISSRVIDSYFNDYIQKQYEEDLSNIASYAGSLLGGEITSLSQARIELSQYLSDMIVGISIYDREEELILSVGSRASRGHSPMGMNPGFRNMVEEIEYFLEGEKGTGTLEIYRLETTTSSETVSLFQAYLLRTVTLSGIFTLLIALILLAFISKKLTRDLEYTAHLAEAVDTSTTYSLIPSRITEIKSIQRALMDLGAKLKVKEGIRKERADRIAHEARTPLTLLKAHMEGVKDGVVAFDEERLNLWLGEVENLSGLLSDLGRILDDSKSLRVIRESFDLKDTLTKVVEAMAMSFKEKHIELTLSLPSENAPYHQGKNLIAQNLYNLLTNAYKYVPEGSKVNVVLTGDESGGYAIEVRDSGHTLKPDELMGLFTPYTRGRNAQGSKGRGMGLHIVKENTQALGGTVRAFLSEDGMTTVGFTLISE
ncbi:MAG: hypothetical protein AVO33_11075 [delta proteobacterium ML8_F1]|nr:MAG: hypothetical protein AVO33_11075 [delta proteobacterium ML8_F1]